MNAATELGFQHLYIPPPATPSDWTLLLLRGTGGD